MRDTEAEDRAIAMRGERPLTAEELRGFGPPVHPPVKVRPTVSVRRMKDRHGCWRLTPTVGFEVKF